MHITIVPDGNRRWAKQQGVSFETAYKRGGESLERCIAHARRLGVHYLTIWVLSCDNLKRDPAWVSMYLDLLNTFLPSKCREAIQNNIRIRFIGRPLNHKITQTMQTLEAESAHNTEMVLTFAINYSGTYDLLQAYQRLINEGVSEISEEMLEQALLTFPVPAPQLLIRTSGEQRISNYMLWQLAQTEFYFVKKHWPDFTEQDLDEAISAFYQRQPRWGR